MSRRAVKAYRVQQKAHHNLCLGGFSRRRPPTDDTSTGHNAHTLSLLSTSTASLSTLGCTVNTLGQYAGQYSRPVRVLLVGPYGESPVSSRDSSCPWLFAFFPLPAHQHPFPPPKQSPPSILSLWTDAHDVSTALLTSAVGRTSTLHSILQR